MRTGIGHTRKFVFFGGGRHLEFEFLGISQSLLKIFASNLVCRQILAIQGYHCHRLYPTFAKIEDCGGRHLEFEFLAISRLQIKTFASHLVCRQILAIRRSLWSNIPLLINIKIQWRRPPSRIWIVSHTLVIPLLAKFATAAAAMLYLNFWPYLGHG